MVGHSFGTMVALSLFERHPAVPGSLVLVGGYAGWAGSLPPEEVARRLKMFLGMADLGDAFDPKSYPGLFTDLIPADRDAALVTMIRENIRPASVRAGGYIGAETDLRPLLPTVDVPTLVLHGEADARSPLANAQALHAAISTSQDSLCSPGSAMRAWWRIPSVRGSDPPVRDEPRLTVPVADRHRRPVRAQARPGGSSRYLLRVACRAVPGSATWCLSSDGRRHWCARTAR